MKYNIKEIVKNNYVGEIKIDEKFIENDFFVLTSNDLDGFLLCGKDIEKLRADIPDAIKLLFKINYEMVVDIRLLTETSIFSNCNIYRWLVFLKQSENYKKDKSKDIKIIKDRISAPEAIEKMLAGKEEYNIHAYQNEHGKQCDNNKGRYQYILSSNNGIGTCISIRCCICKEEKDITDYSIF